MEKLQTYRRVFYILYQTCRTFYFREINVSDPDSMWFQRTESGLLTLTESLQFQPVWSIYALLSIMLTLAGLHSSPF
jgi:hypothetical protein